MGKQEIGGFDVSVDVFMLVDVLEDVELERRQREVAKKKYTAKGVRTHYRLCTIYNLMYHPLKNYTFSYPDLCHMTICGTKFNEKEERIGCDL